MSILLKWIGRCTGYGSQRQLTSRRTRSRLNGFEQLQARTVLAGNVLATIDGGNLELLGDSDDNSIIVDQAGLAADQFRVSSGSNPTLINGGSGPVILSGITKGLKAKLEDGADRLELNGTTFNDNVKIEGGNGSNQIDIATLVVDGDFEIRGKDGFDIVAMTDADVSGNAKFEYEDGGDDGIGSFRSSRTTLSEITIAGNLEIKGDQGVDAASFDGAVIEGNVKIETKEGGTTFFGAFAGAGVFLQGTSIAGNLDVKNESGIDQLELLETFIGGDTKIENGEGGDFGDGTVVGTLPSLIADSQFDGNFEIHSKSGRDLQLTIDDSTFLGNSKIEHGKGGSDTSITGSSFLGNLEVKADDGDDSVSLDGLTVVGDTKIKTGDDDDFISVVDSVFAKFEADGGDGMDTFDDLGGNTYEPGSPKLEHIEVIL